jgi:hypothetical protein
MTGWSDAKDLPALNALDAALIDLCSRHSEGDINRTTSK